MKAAPRVGRIWLIGAVLLGLVGVVLVPSPAWATASVSITVNSFSRDATTGVVSWNVDAVVGSATSSDCSYDCGIALQAHTSDGWRYLQSSSTNLSTSSFSLVSSSSDYSAAYDSVRVQYGGSSTGFVTSSSVAVTDSVLARSLTMTVNSFARSASTGVVSWNIDAAMEPVKLFV